MMLARTGSWVTAVVMILLLAIAGPVLLPIGAAILIERYGTAMRAAVAKGAF